jgi:phytol kinase
MNKDYLNLALLAAGFLTLFGTAEFIYHYFKVNGETTRKIVHLGTGFITLLFPVLLNNHWLVLLLCSSFLLILLLSLKFNLLQSINDINRKSHGSILYPVAVYMAYLAYDYSKINMPQAGYTFFYLPVLTLAICDPIAAVVGKKWPAGRYRIVKDYKTVSGSLAFLCTSFLLSLFLFTIGTTPLFFQNTIIASLTLAITTTVAEAFSFDGSDNLSIPAVAIATLFLIHNFGVL